MNKAQFKALTRAPKQHRNKIGGRIIRIQAIANVPKPMSSINGDFLYYFNGFLVVNKKSGFFLRQTNKFKKSYDERMNDENDGTGNRKR